MEPYDDILAEAATRFDLDPEVLARYLQAESSGDPNAMSNKGATGLMQLMPATAAEMGYSEEDLLDPYKNIMAGSQYIRKLTDDFTANPVGDIPLEDLVPAGYNSGPGNVRKYGGIPPFEETQNYVKKINPGHGQEPEGDGWELSNPNMSKIDGISSLIQKQGMSSNDVRSWFTGKGYDFPEEAWRDHVEEKFRDREVFLRDGGAVEDVADIPLDFEGMIHNAQAIQARGAASIVGGAMQIPEFIADVPGVAVDAIGWAKDRNLLPMQPGNTNEEEDFWKAFGEALKMGDDLPIISQVGRAGEDLTSALAAGQTRPVRQGLRSLEILGENLDLIYGGGAIGKKLLNKYVLLDPGDMSRAFSYGDDVVRQEMRTNIVKNTSKYLDVEYSQDDIEGAAKFAKEVNEQIVQAHQEKISKIDNSVLRLREQRKLNEIYTGAKRDILKSLVEDAKVVSELPTNEHFTHKWKAGNIKRLRRTAQIIADEAIVKDPVFASEHNAAYHIYRASNPRPIQPTLDGNIERASRFFKKYFHKPVAKKGKPAMPLHRRIAMSISSKDRDLQRISQEIHAEMSRGGRSQWPQHLHKLRDMGNYSTNDVTFRTSKLSREGNTIWSGESLKDIIGHIDETKLEHIFGQGAIDRHLIDGLRKMALYNDAVQNRKATASSIRRSKALLKSLRSKVNPTAEDASKMQTHLKIIEDSTKNLELYKAEMGRYRFTSPIRTTEDMAEWKGNIEAIYGEDGLVEIGETLSRYKAWEIRSTLDKYLDSGRLSQKEYDRILPDNEYHQKILKFIGEVEDESVFSMHPSQWKSANEAGKDLQAWRHALTTDGAMHPLEAGAQRAIAVQQWYVRQKSINSFVEDWMDLARAKGTKNPKTGKVEPNFQAAKEATGIEFKPTRTKPSDGTPHVTVWNDGKPTHYLTDKHHSAMLNDEAGKWLDAARMVRMGGFEAFGKTWRPGSAVVSMTRVFRNTATATLQFMMKNPLRDMWSAQMLQKYGGRLLIDLGEGMYHLIRQKHSKSADEALTILDQFYRDGMGLSNITAIDSPMAPHNLEALLTATKRADFMQRYRATNSQSRIEGFFFPLEEGARLSDIALRIGTLARLRRRAAAGKGLKPSAAVDAAANFKNQYPMPKEMGKTTFAQRYKYWRGEAGAPTPLDMYEDVRSSVIDFNEFGDFGRFLNSLWAFTNPVLREVAQIGRSVRERPVSTTANWLRGMGGFTTLLWLSNKDNPEYHKLSNDQKAIWFHLWYEEDKQRWAVLPKGHLVGLIGSTGWEYVLQTMYDNSPNKEDWTDLLRQVLFNVMPIKSAPTAVAGPSEVIANVDTHTGMPIDSDTSIEGMGRVDDFTRPSTELMSYQANKATGGIIDLSPNQIEHLIESYTTQYGKGFMSVMDDILSKVQNEDLSKRIEGLRPVHPMLDFPGVRSFIKIPEKVFYRNAGHGTRSKVVKQFREHYYDERRTARAVRKFEDSGRYVQAYEVIQRNPFALPEANRMLSEVNESISDRSKHIQIKTRALAAAIDGAGTVDDQDEMFQATLAQILGLRREQEELATEGMVMRKVIPKLVPMYLESKGGLEGARERAEQEKEEFRRMLIEMIKEDLSSER